MARARDRIIALVLAGIFFVTSIALGVMVIWQTVSGDKEAQSVNGSMQDDKPSAEELADAATPTVNKPSDKPLQGTQLAQFAPIPSVADINNVDMIVGTGKPVGEHDVVTVDYIGAVASTGTIFQASQDAGRPVTFSLDGVIQGWREGLLGMKEGGTRRLYITADKAYGANPPQGSGIPINADLVFEVKLYQVTEQ